MKHIIGFQELTIKLEGARARGVRWREEVPGATVRLQRPAPSDPPRPPSPAPSQRAQPGARQRGDRGLASAGSGALRTPVGLQGVRRKAAHFALTLPVSAVCLS